MTRIIAVFVASNNDVDNLCSRVGSVRPGINQHTIVGGRRLAGGGCAPAYWSWHIWHSPCGTFMPWKQGQCRLPDSGNILRDPIIGVLPMLFPPLYSLSFGKAVDFPSSASITSIQHTSPIDQSVLLRSFTPPAPLAPGLDMIF